MPNYQISRKSVQWEPSCCIRTDMKPIVAFRNLTIAPNNSLLSLDQNNLICDNLHVVSNMERQYPYCTELHWPDRCHIMQRVYDAKSGTVYLYVRGKPVLCVVTIQRANLCYALPIAQHMNEHQPTTTRRESFCQRNVWQGNDAQEATSTARTVAFIKHDILPCSGNEKNS
jgi:hypothetical protein